MKRNYLREIAEVQNHHQRLIKGKNTLNKDDLKYLEQQKQSHLKMGMDVALALDQEFNELEQAKIKTRKPLSTSNKIEEKKLGFQASQFATDIFNFRQPKGYMTNKVEEAILMDNRDFLSEIYDRMSEQKPENSKELDFNHSILNKIQNHFGSKTNLKDLEARSQELRSQRVGSESFLNAIDYGKPIDSISSYNNAYTNGALK